MNKIINKLLMQIFFSRFAEYTNWILLQLKITYVHQRPQRPMVPPTSYSYTKNEVFYEGFLQ